MSSWHRVQVFMLFHASTSHQTKDHPEITGDNALTSEITGDNTIESLMDHESSHKKAVPHVMLNSTVYFHGTQKLLVTAL